MQLHYFHSQGVTVGGLAGFMFSMWLAMGSYSVKSYATDMLPLLDDNCPTANITTNITQPWAGVNITEGYTNSRDEDNRYVNIVNMGDNWYSKDIWQTQTSQSNEIE